MKFTLAVCALVGVLLVLLTGCGLSRAIPTHTTTVKHGPFDIVASGRRISTGSFPNTGGNPFATREVTSFSVRWRGQDVDVPQVGTRFWRVLRLAAAPQPALLVLTTDFHLVTEEQGRLVVRSYGSKSTDLPRLQWLDSENGQPGTIRNYGIQHVDADAGTQLAGGRWLLLSNHTVLDVKTLQHHDVRPIVPAGQPLAGLNAGNTTARLFSPGGTQYALPAYQRDSAGQRQDSLVVVDIPGRTAYGLPLDRQRMRFADEDDLHTALLSHFFEWTRDAQGRERLRPRSGVSRMPWQGRFIDFDERVEYRVQPVAAAMNDELRRFVVERLGGRVVPDADNPTVKGGTFMLPGCDHVVVVSHHDDHTGAYVPMARTPPFVRCQDSVRRIGEAFNAELARGRLDALFLTAAR